MFEILFQNDHVGGAHVSLATASRFRTEAAL